MSDSSDSESNLQCRPDNCLEFYLAPLYIFFHTANLYPKYRFVPALVIYALAIGYFRFVTEQGRKTRDWKVPLVSIVFMSFFASELLINQRILVSSSQSTRTYAIIGLTIITSIFLILLVTGTVEPYQGGLVFLAFYILQARYRTSTISLTSIQEDKNRRILPNDNKESASKQP